MESSPVKGGTQYRTSDGVRYSDRVPSRGVQMVLSPVKGVKRVPYSPVPQAEPDPTLASRSVGQSAANMRNAPSAVLAGSSTTYLSTCSEEEEGA